MSPRTLAGGAALLTALAAPATAQALPTMAPLEPCYVTAGPLESQREGVVISAAGFTPNSDVAVTVPGAPQPNAKAGMSGTLSFEVAAPYVKRGIEEFTITLTEVGNEANTVSATAKSTALGVSLKPTSAKPSDKVRFEGLGFTNDAPIYAHYLHKGKLRKTVRMARKPRQCGGFRVHRRQIPIPRPGLGDWIVRFDQSKQLTRPPDGNYVRLRIVLRLVPPR